MNIVTYKSITYFYSMEQYTAHTTSTHGLPRNSVISNVVPIQNGNFRKKDNKYGFYGGQKKEKTVSISRLLFIKKRRGRPFEVFKVQIV